VELSWPMRLRIGASAAIGVILIGFWAWPLAAPSEPFGVVSLANGSISPGGAMILAGLAFLAGLLAYFLSWPYGREIGVLAVPSGLAVWAVRTGSMANLMQTNPDLLQRQALFTTLKWEPAFWLAVVALGFLGVFAGGTIRSKYQSNRVQKETTTKSNIYLNSAIALVGSGLITQVCIGILARNVRMYDSELGSVVAQPTVGQIVFAVFVSFGIATFIVKEFLNAGYSLPIIGGTVVMFYNINTYARQSVLEHLIQTWPPVFFPNAVISILPVQMVTFGTLGGIAGYWLAVRHNYWRKHG